MRKLLTAPSKMALSESENILYQNMLQQVTDLSLNFMAVKVNADPQDFLSWCQEMLRISKHDLRHDLLEDKQLPVLKKLQDLFIKAISLSQLKMLRIAPWPIFSDYVQQNSEVQALTERLSMLDYVKGLATQPLAELNELDRLVFAGKHSADHDVAVYQFDAEWFGSTKSAKAFHTMLSTSPEKFDAALSHIPQEGEVTRAQFSAFARELQTIFSQFVDQKAEGEKATVAVASRLLAMRRPDVFVSVTSSKLDLLCQGLGLSRVNNFDLMGYWDEIIETLQMTSWWRTGQPASEAELQVWSVRAVMVDLFFYADEDTASSSNFIKLRDKPARAPRNSSGTRRVTKRSKETAETLVQKRLEQGDLPDYFQSKKDALVNEVKAGKSLEEVIKLMRAIFG